MTESVFLAYPHAHHVSEGFMQAVVNEVLNGEYIAEVHGERCYPGDDLALGRNRIIRTFLKSPYDWLFMVDTDVVFPLGAARDLQIVANDYIENGIVPVVSGWYNLSLEKYRGLQGVPGETQVVPAAWRYRQAKLEPRRGPFTVSERVDAVGAGCLLVHRSSLERFTEQNWFSIIREHPLKSYGEDFSFCIRLRQFQIPLIFEPAVRCLHHKEHWI